MTYGELRWELRDILEELKQYDYYEEVPFWTAAWLAKLVIDIRGMNNE